MIELVTNIIEAEHFIDYDRVACRSYLIVQSDTKYRNLIERITADAIVRKGAVLSQ